MKRRKFILSVVAMLTAMLFSSVNSSVYAKKSKKEPVEVVNSGICGDSVCWKFSPDSGLLVISGKGAINNYNFPGSPTPWKRTSIDSLIIEEGVTEIGDYAFYYCENLRNVCIPNSLTRIGAFSFTGCNGIDSLDIPASVRSIEHSAFCYCRNIKNLKIQSDSIDIAAFAFGFCDSLKANAYTYIAEGRHISHCAFYKFSDAEEQSNDSTKTSNEKNIEQTDSIQNAKDSLRMKLFEKIEIIAPKL